MGAGAIAGLTDEKQKTADMVRDFLNANWWPIWQSIDAENRGFVRATVLRQWLIDNAGTKFGDCDPFFARMTGADGAFKDKVFRRAFAHVTLRDGSHENTNIYDYEFRRLCRYMVLMNELGELCGETEGEEKTLNKEEFVTACKACFATLDDATYDRAFVNIDDLGGNKWANEKIAFDEFSHYVITVMDA